jgi:hypothetical protein
MKTPHAQALQSFARSLQWLLTLRLAVQLATVWLFVWGVVVLGARILGAENTFWLALGLFGIVPLLAIAFWQAKRQVPEFPMFRQNFDRLNRFGGVLMSEEAADMDAWIAQLPAATVPKFHWQSGRAMLMLGLAGLFAATALLLPERLTHIASHASLEIGQTVEQLQAEVRTLAQEKLVDEKKTQDVEKQLAQLQKESSSVDPDKTWEALDHIKQANTDVAKQAAEEAANKMETMSQAEAFTKAMQQAADEGMNQATANQAAQDLASMLNSAKLEDGILNGKIPPELLANLNGLNKEQMQKLMQALEMNKNAMAMTMSNLANLKMIDPATLAKCKNAMECPNSDELSKYLSQCKGGESDILFSWLTRRSRGGPGRGGPEAPLDWDNNTSEKDTKFQEHALPPSTHLSDAQLVGVSKSAPQLASDDVAAAHGALDGATASGGSAHSQAILPEYRQTVQNFFKRDDK